MKRNKEKKEMSNNEITILIGVFFAIIIGIGGFIRDDFNPLDRRFLYDPQGTVADVRIGGSGYEHSKSAIWYRVLNTGTGTGENFINCDYNIPEDEWKNFTGTRQIEVGINNRDARINENAVFMIGSSLALIYQHYKNQLSHEYCAFWLIGNTTYRGDLKIYARTQKGYNYQEDYITFISYAKRIILRIEMDNEEIRYYIDNILKVTHTPYTWVQTGTPYVKTGIWNNETQDASIVFYPLICYSDY